LAAEGIDAEVIDLRTLVPLDREGVFTSVKKTGRLVVVDEDYLSYGVTGEIIATIAERDPALFKAPPQRVAFPDIPIPYSRPMEQFALPSTERIASAVRGTIKNRRAA
jgi:acetoin:2,6-dichlorophenolindophenol oxidoreductase subunit beta